MCEKILFGTMPDGEPVYLCRLDNRRGTRAEILSLGGIIRGIWTVDRNGNTADVVLGQDNLQAYLENPSCSGAVIGRVAISRWKNPGRTRWSFPCGMRGKMASPGKRRSRYVIS